MTSTTLNSRDSVYSSTSPFLTHIILVMNPSYDWASTSGSLTCRLYVSADDRVNQRHPHKPYHQERKTHRIDQLVQPNHAEVMTVNVLSLQYVDVTAERARTINCRVKLAGQRYVNADHRFIARCQTTVELHSPVTCKAYRCRLSMISLFGHEGVHSHSHTAEKEQLRGRG